MMLVFSRIENSEALFGRDVRLTVYDRNAFYRSPFAPLRNWTDTMKSLRLKQSSNGLSGMNQNEEF